MLLEVKNLVVEVEGKRVLNGVNLAIREGETHVLLGPNGAGKSTLFLTILGFPKYKVVEGSIIFNGEDITDLTTTERVQKGLGVSFQNPPAIRGVSVRDLLKLESKQDPDEELNPRMKELAEKYGKSIAQICIRFGLQMGYLPLPKSVTPSRIVENFQVFDFELEEADVKPTEEEEEKAEVEKAD